MVKMSRAPAGAATSSVDGVANRVAAAAAAAGSNVGLQRQHNGSEQ
jgi:hypothetical protein